MARPYHIEPLDRGLDDAFAQFAEWDSHPLRGDFAERLYRTVFGAAHADHSFMVVGRQGPVVVARCTVGAGTAGFFGKPLLLVCRSDLAGKDRRAGLASAIDHLVELAGQEAAGTVLVAGRSAPEPDLVDCLCIDRSAHGTIQGHAIIDLSLEADALRRDIRDSYRSLVNWGTRNISLSHVNAGNPDRACFELYPDFHAKVAGGSKRGSAYWDVYWQEIVAGRGELTLGFLEGGELVSGTLVVDAGRTAYYASGVYDREQFDKPIAHYPLWQAILRAKERGLDWFDLGEILAHGQGTEKEVSIGFFKRGFTARRQSWVNWSIAVLPR